MIASRPSARATGRSVTPITAGTPIARAKIATCEDDEPLAETMPASRSFGTSASCIALTSSPTRMVCGG